MYFKTVVLIKRFYVLLAGPDIKFDKYFSTNYKDASKSE